MATSLDDLIKLQSRIFDLWEQGASSNDQNFKTTMNRLMSLTRYTDPETLAAFEKWRTEEGARRKTERDMGNRNP